MGGDAEELAQIDQLTISIHAPVWGATDLGEGAVIGIEISIHAPVWGATANLYKNKLLQICKMT